MRTQAQRFDDLAAAAIDEAAIAISTARMASDKGDLEDMRTYLATASAMQAISRIFQGQAKRERRDATQTDPRDAMDGAADGFIH
jgi:hypothetical protein